MEPSRRTLLASGAAAGAAATTLVRERLPRLRHHRGHVAGTTFFGATIGRCGNRIANGRFALDGTTYQLSVNDGANSLHGGAKGFNTRVWDVEDFNSGSDVGLKLHYTSVDGEMGYPGTLRAKVAGTPFDFRSAKPIGRDIRTAHPQLVTAKGFDHNWVLDKGITARPVHFATLRDPSSGRTLEIATDQPGVQFHSGNFLDGTLTGPSGAPTGRATACAWRRSTSRTRRTVRRSRRRCCARARRTGRRQCTRSAPDRPPPASPRHRP